MSPETISTIILLGSFFVTPMLLVFQRYCV